MIKLSLNRKVPIFCELITALFATIKLSHKWWCESRFG